MFDMTVSKAVDPPNMAFSNDVDNKAFLDDIISK
jgi:hypothetical protein